MSKEFENRHRKLDKYWPENIIEYDDVKKPFKDENYALTCIKIEEDETNQTTIRTIKIEGPNETSHIFTHVYYQKWADHGTPLVDAFKNILAKIEINLVQGNKYFTHCSAGIGRTGVLTGCLLAKHPQNLFQLTDNMIETIFGKKTDSDEKIDSDELKSYQILYTLRSERPGMIQTKEQLQFLLDFIKSL